MKKKKIVLFIGCLTGGGAERVTANLANFLDKHHFDITIITMSNIKDTYRVNKSIKREYLLDCNERTNKIKDNLLRYKRLKEYMQTHQEVDCYIVMLPITIFMLCSLRKYTQAKVIVCERNNPSSYKLYEKIIMKYSQRRCDALMVQTDTIGKWYKHKNMITIPNAINEEILVNRQKKMRDNRIVTVGRLTDQKNHEMLIRAFGQIANDYPDYMLEIYGQGPREKKLRKLVDKLGLKNQVYFKGYVSDINKKIIDAKMFVMTSNYEGMPNALIEAMCLGIPCISTDCDGGGAREIIKNNVNGILIPKNDINSLVSSMKKILSDDNFAKKLEKNSLELRKELNCDIIYNRWCEFIKKQII